MVVKAVLCLPAVSCKCSLGGENPTQLLLPRCHRGSLMDDCSTSRLQMIPNSRALFSDFRRKMSRFLFCFPPPDSFQNPTAFKGSPGYEIPALGEKRQCGTWISG